MCDCEQECDCEDGCNCGEGDDCEPEGNCCHRSAQLRGVMHIAILSLLKGKETHGSDLCLSIKDRFGMDVAKPVIYMTLRRLERHGLLVSHWDMAGSGPAKRVYRITEDGIEYLNESIGELKRMADVIERMIEECGKQPGP